MARQVDRREKTTLTILSYLCRLRLTHFLEINLAVSFYFRLLLEPTEVRTSKSFWASETLVPKRSTCAPRDELMARFRAKRVQSQLRRVEELVPGVRDQNMALTVLYVPNFLDTGVMQ